MSDHKTLADAVADFKMAWWNVWTPLLTPVLDFLDRILRRFSR